MATTTEAGPRLVAVDAARCDRCLACLAACPEKALREPVEFRCSRCVHYCLGMDVPCTHAVVAVCEDLCTGCGACLAACPRGAIGWADGGGSA